MHQLQGVHEATQEPWLRWLGRRAMPKPTGLRILHLDLRVGKEGRLLISPWGCRGRGAGPEQPGRILRREGWGGRGTPGGPGEGRDQRA